MQASSAFASAGAAAPDEFYDVYTMDLEAEGHWSRARRRFMRHRLAVASLLIVTVVFTAGFLASHLAPYGYEEVNIKALNSGPSLAHPFGTDQAGRDYFSRTLYGLRTEAEVALVIGFFGTLIGTLIGAVAGYLGGFADMVVMRLADLLLTVPPLVTVLVAAAFLQVDTLFEFCVLLGCLLWMPVARVVRSTALVIREQEYVQAAHAMGASNLRIIRKHVLPNAISSVAVAASVMTASAVIIETTLSYLGLGIGGAVRYYGGRTDTKLPSVGDVLAAAQNEGLFHWWGIVLPGVVVILIVAPIYVVGDGIRDALDPTQRRYVTERELARRRRGPSRVTRLIRSVPRPQVSVRITMPRALLQLVDALPRRRARERSPMRLLLEVFAVLAFTALGGAAVYEWKVNPVKSAWSFAGADVVNVSRAPGAQTQVDAAVDPAHPGALFAVSNDTSLRTVRVYASRDRGRSWSSSVGPSLGVNACARGEPAAAVDTRGREYVAFSVSATCTAYDPSPYVAVAVRSGPTGSWKVHRLGTRRPADFWDDYPSVAAGPGGRVYVVWSRLLRWTYEGVVVSSSADGGRTWSNPRVVSSRLSLPRLATASVASDGALYVAGVDSRLGVWVGQSRDGAEHFRLSRVASLPGNQAAECATASRHPTPFQGIRCIGPNPTVATTSDRVFVTYGVGLPGETQSVHVGVLDSSLRRISSGPVGQPDASADRFWPTSTVDAATGRLWVCFYDTSGDKSRKQAWFSCASSRDGRIWARPLRVARDSASPEVLWEDARVYSYGDMIGFGGYTSIAAAGGVVHPMWIDTRDLGGNKQEIFTARVP